MAFFSQERPEAEQIWAYSVTTLYDRSVYEIRLTLLKSSSSKESFCRSHEPIWNSSEIYKLPFRIFFQGTNQGGWESWVKIEPEETMILFYIERWLQNSAYFVLL